MLVPAVIIVSLVRSVRAGYEAALRTQRAHAYREVFGVDYPGDKEYRVTEEFLRTLTPEQREMLKGQDARARWMRAEVAP